MKRSRVSRVRSAVNNTIENLEQRQLLSATMVSAIPAQTLNTSSAATAINLSTYFDDPAVASGDTVVNIQTNLPSPDQRIPLELTTAATPNTVANFLKYISSGEYANTIIHRSISDFIIQGGGYTTDGNAITSLGTINGESSTEVLKNTPGTIAMALTGTQANPAPNSGSDNWFINLATNSDLDNASDGGPFTVFGQTLYTGLTVAQDIAALPTVDDETSEAWTNLPVQNYSGTTGATVASIPAADFVVLNPVVVTGGLTYTVASSNSAVVSTSVSDDGLSLTPVGNGTASITVTATDLGGGTTSSSFSVDVGAAAAPTVSIAAATGTIGTDTQVVFPVTLSATSTTDTTFSYALSADTASTSDYSATGSTLTIPAGSASASIPVNISADSLGANETFTITLSGLSSNATFSGGGTTETAIGTIAPVAGTKVSTTTTLQALAPSLAAGSSDTFVATVTPIVSGASPTGTVVFSAGGTPIGSAGVSGGTATLTASLTAAGNQTITAVYGGSSTYSTSASAGLTINVSTLTPAVAHSSLPSTIVQGIATHGTVIVSATNSLASAMKGSALFEVYASTDGYIDSTAVLLGSTKAGIALAPNRTVSVPVQIKSIPAALAVGSYTLVAQTVDPAQQTSDAAAKGPSLTYATPVIKLSESITKLAIPTSVVAGAKTSSAAVIKITNSGNIVSSGTTTIMLYTSTDGTVAAGTSFKTLSRVLKIGVGKSVTVPIPLGDYPSGVNGEYFITDQVTDPAGNTSSADYSTAVTFAAAHIDLANTLAVIPTTAKVGKTIAVTIDLVNNGNINATGLLQIAFSTSTASDGSSPVALETVSTHINLKATQEQTLHLHVLIPKDAAPGAVYLVSVVDPTDVFKDSDLSNNTDVSASAITLS